MQSLCDEQFPYNFRHIHKHVQFLYAHTHIQESDTIFPLYSLHPFYSLHPSYYI